MVIDLLLHLFSLITLSSSISQMVAYSFLQWLLILSVAGGYLFRYIKDNSTRTSFCNVLSCCFTKEVCRPLATRRGKSAEKKPKKQKARTAVSCYAILLSIFICTSHLEVCLPSPIDIFSF